MQLSPKPHDLWQNHIGYKTCFGFPYNFCCMHFLHDKHCVTLAMTAETHASTYKVSVIAFRFQQTSVKLPNTNFHENTFVGSLVLIQTDTHSEVNMQTSTAIRCKREKWNEKKGNAWVGSRLCQNFTLSTHKLFTALWNRHNTASLSICKSSVRLLCKMPLNWLIHRLDKK
jgi:hypothetical protein